MCSISQSVLLTTVEIGFNFCLVIAYVLILWEDFPYIYHALILKLDCVVHVLSS